MRLPTYQDLSKEQDAINNLPLDGSYLVSGPPGTGKTVMALYRTAMISRKGAKATLLTYSRLLSAYLKAATDELELDGHVKTFHSWFYGFYRRCYRSAPPQLEPYHYDYDEILSIVNRDPPEPDSLEYLLIDEAQDLNKGFFPVAGHIAKRLTVFADENQKLTEENSTLNDIRTMAGITAETHELRRNYRNTAEIAAVAARFYTGLPSGMPDPPVRGGEKPSAVALTSIGKEVDFIARYERVNPTKTIGVFLRTTNQQNRFFNRLKKKAKGDVRCYIGRDRNDDEIRFDEPGIIVVNYLSAKGLEFDAVFLPELQTATDDASEASVRMTFYVLCSRAREDLFFLYAGDEEPAILSSLLPDLVTRRSVKSA